jgi:hypothetical protein
MVAACSGGGDKKADGDAATNDTTADTEVVLDQSPFCVAIRSLEAMGTEPDAGDGTPAAVLTQNEQLVALLDEATASAPADAPGDVQAFLDDYQVLSDAITVAAGDTEAAFATLSTDQPELMARLGAADAHKEAFTFFAERCGTAPPPGPWVCDPNAPDYTERRWQPPSWHGNGDVDSRRASAGDGRRQRHPRLLLGRGALRPSRSRDRPRPVPRSRGC